VLVAGAGNGPLMPEFGIELAGDREIDLRFETFPERARAALEARIGGLTQSLLARVKGDEPEKSGRLKGETVAGVRSSKYRVTGTVRVAARDQSEFGKAGALEYGSKGDVQVRAHAIQLGHVFHRLIAPTAVLVAAYTRQPAIAARRYLEEPLAGMREEAIEAMREAISEALAF
jgi:hypothetical protein